MGRFEWDVRLAALVAGTFRIVFRRARVSRSDTIPVFREPPSSSKSNVRHVHDCDGLADLNSGAWPTRRHESRKEGTLKL